MGMLNELYTIFDALVETHDVYKVYLTQSVFEVVLQKSIPTQICQLILYISKSKGYVDGFVGQLTSAKRL